VTHLVAAAGTGGTITGAGRYLKERNPRIRVVGGDPLGSILRSYAESGTKPEGVPYKVEGIGQDKVPTTLDLGVIDDYVTVTDRDAFTMARRLTREEGLFVGGSSGLIAHVALGVARRVNDPDALVVTFLCDTGERYLSKLYSDEWMRENQMLDAERGTVGEVLVAKPGDATDIVAVAPGAAVRQALRLMSQHGVSQLPVLDGASCVGSVSESALTVRGLEDPKSLDRSVADVMEAPFPIVEASQPAEGVVKLLTKSNRALLVRVDGALRGLVTRGDLLDFLTR
jgi:cystathionine beta-synthase